LKKLSFATDSIFNVDSSSVLELSSKNNNTVNTSIPATSKLTLDTSAQQSKKNSTKKYKDNTKNAKEIIKLKGINKSFDGRQVLYDLDLTVYNGEFLTLLGPSGCGKTTTLRIIAGFESEDSGSIYINGELIKNQPPIKRGVNTVFQSYALFPHMTVYNNVAFGLKMNKVSKQEIHERVMKILTIVKLEEFIDRKPHQLSGGQQQRVALARAVVNNPLVLLLDEPLSALDASLRKDMQNELKQLQKKLGITFILVTHDQEEALSMSDRVVVMNEGIIEQIGSPKNVYEEPNSLFVASFIGDINIFDAEVLRHIDKDLIEARVEGRVCTVSTDKKLSVGDNFKLLLRPEDMRIEKLSEEPNTEGLMIGNIEVKTYKGATLDSLIRLNNGKQIKASEFFDEEDEDIDYNYNEKVSIGWVSGWEVIITDDNDN